MVLAGLLLMQQGQFNQQIAAQAEVPDIWLAFAPIKKTPADYVAQKATELGVRALQPTITRRTVSG